MNATKTAAVLDGFHTTSFTAFSFALDLYIFLFTALRPFLTTRVASAAFPRFFIVGVSTTTRLVVQFKAGLIRFLATVKLWIFASRNRLRYGFRNRFRFFLHALRLTETLGLGP